MRGLIDFLYRIGNTVLFFALQVLSVWLIATYNNRYNANFLNSSNVMAAGISNSSQNVFGYFKLKKINEQLILENEQLQARLNSTHLHDHTTDTVDAYTVIGARVINNTFRRAKNFLTMDVGAKNNVAPGMGVLSAFGMVGVVKSVSDRYASVYSLLHPNVMVSSMIKRTSTLCTVQWDQKIHDKASLRFIPRHIDLKAGDTVVTSGYNSVFPPGINVGVVNEVILADHMTFYSANVKLSTDFTSLTHVFVITNELKDELDSLQAYE